MDRKPKLKIDLESFRALASHADTKTKRLIWRQIGRFQHRPASQAVMVASYVTLARLVGSRG